MNEVELGHGFLARADRWGRRRIHHRPSTRETVVAFIDLPKEDPSVSDVTLTPTQQVIATATGLDAQGNALPTQPHFTFAAGDPSIADVIDNGDNTALIVAHAAGDITVSATEPNSGITGSGSVSIAAALASVVVTMGTPEEQPAAPPALDSASVDFGQPTDQPPAAAPDAAPADAAPTDAAPAPDVSADATA